MNVFSIYFFLLHPCCGSVMTPHRCFDGLPQTSTLRPYRFLLRIYGSKWYMRRRCNEKIVLEVNWMFDCRNTIQNSVRQVQCAFSLRMSSQHLKINFNFGFELVITTICNLVSIKQLSAHVSCHNVSYSRF